MMVRHAVLDRYESGWKAIRGESIFFAKSPEGEKFDFGSSQIARGRKRVRLFTALCVKFGGVPKLEDPEVVPVEVAAAGKPFIAGYLWAVHFGYYTPEKSYRPDEIADRLNVTPKSVTTYCRRVIRSVEDEKVGGIGE
jgi:hypothetical protein